MLRKILDVDCEQCRKRQSGKKLTFIHILPTEIYSNCDPWSARNQAVEDSEWRNKYGVGWKVPKQLPDLLYPSNAMEEE